jgi:hypothetical protein
MNSILDLQTVLRLATIVGLVVIVQSFLRIFNVGWGLIVSVIAIAIVLQYGFDISPRELWYEFIHLPQYLVRLAKNVA